MKASLLGAAAAGLFWIASWGNTVAYGQTLTADAAPSTNPPSGPAPRLADGKVDLGGKGVWAPICVLDWADKKYVEQNIDVPFTPAGLELYKERQATHSKDDPADPNPTWLGESIGWYEGNDTLVVDTIGFNGRTWLDYVGHPASDQLHVVERFTRPNNLSLHYEAIIEDPKNYTKPWTIKFNVKWRQGWEIQEYVCLENNKDLIHLGTKEPT